VAADSLRQGKLQGISRFRPDLALKKPSKVNFLSTNSLWNPAGNFFALAGKLLRPSSEF